MAKPVRLRRAAVDDVTATISYLLTEVGPDTANSFVDALERVLARIGGAPHTGTLRFAYQLDIEGLRAWPIRPFPHVVFYVEREANIDVWRVLHARRDIGTSLLEPDET